MTQLQCIHVIQFNSIISLFTVPPPSILISVLPSAGPYTAGTRVAFTCYVLFISPVDTGMMVNITWRKNSTGAVVGYDSSPLAPVITMNYSSTIMFDPVGTEDSDIYICGASIGSPSSFTFLNVSFVSNFSDYLHSIKCE